MTAPTTDLLPEDTDYQQTISFPPSEDHVRITLTLPVEVAESLQLVSNYTGLTISGVIQIFLEDSTARDIATHIREVIEFDPERFKDLPPYARKALAKKRPTPKNLQAVRLQIGELVPGGVKVGVYKGVKHG